ncbi:hypothetical protein [Streptomyces sp. NPDC088725]|uniref:hypothetical protein n=1 Tax=Streptomyces sp. NPDC088725 TaxID=3365873 RepID=UPI00382B198A
MSVLCGSAVAQAAQPPAPVGTADNQPRADETQVNGTPAKETRGHDSPDHADSSQSETPSQSETSSPNAPSQTGAPHGEASHSRPPAFERRDDDLLDDDEPEDESPVPEPISSWHVGLIVIDNSYADSWLEVDRTLNTLFASNGTAGSDHDGDGDDVHVQQHNRTPPQHECGD